jgi:predicted deacylase
VLCFGGTHGNEYEGQVALKRLCADLDPAQMAGRMVILPQLSESACVANSRISPLDGVNMNRAFPGNPRGTISSRIAHFVKTRIFPLGRVVVDIHSGGMEGAFPHCTSFHPIPDEAQRAETAELARLFDTPFTLIYSSAMASGLLTDEAEAEGKITIGSELGAGASVDRMGVRHAYEGMRNVLRRYGLLEGDIVKIRAAGSDPRFAASINRVRPPQRPDGGHRLVRGAHGQGSHPSSEIARAVRAVLRRRAAASKPPPHASPAASRRPRTGAFRC